MELIWSDFSWLVGIIEGEGSFSAYITRKGRPGKMKWKITVRVGMTDKDVIDRVIKVSQGLGLGVATSTTEGRRSPITGKQYKDAYFATWHGKQAAILMEAMLPHAGERRAAKIREILDARSVRLGHNDRLAEDKRQRARALLADIGL